MHFQSLYQPRKRNRFIFTKWAFGYAILMMLLSSVPAFAEPPTPQNQSNSTYIPLASSGVNEQTTPPPADNPPPDTASSGVFPTRDIKTSSADIAVDSAGGIHVAYAGYVGYGTLSPGYYGYCPASADCTNIQQWRILNFGSKNEYIVKAEIQLTKAGQPRLLFYDEHNGRTYTYAECNASCTNPANWQTANVGDVQSNVDLDTFSYTYHTFALDAQDHPRFIYEDHYGSIHNGLFYRYCDINCTNAANWNETNISLGEAYDGDRAQTPYLRFTSQGQPRLLIQIFSSNPNYADGLYYIACDSNCTNVANWQRLRLRERGNGHASWSLALDSQDQPRVAFYQGEIDNGTGNRLKYLWCDNGCLTLANWHETLVGVEPNNGQSPDLALDQQGRPRIAIAIQEDQGIGYVWCNSQCNGAGQWQAQNAESLNTLNEDYPSTIPIFCDIGTWLGARPQLALDPQGNPRIGYDGEFLVGNSALCSPTISNRAVRFTFFTQP